MAVISTVTMWNILCWTLLIFDGVECCRATMEQQKWRVKTPSQQVNAGHQHQAQHQNASLHLVAAVNASLPRKEHQNVSSLFQHKLPHESAVLDGIVAVVGVIMFGSLVFIIFFFWRRYKFLTASLPTYSYSRLNQCDEVEINPVDDLGLGISLDPSSSEDEIHQPATLTAVTTQLNCPLFAPNHIIDKQEYQNGIVKRVSAAVLEDSDEDLLQ